MTALQHSAMIRTFLDLYAQGLTRTGQQARDAKRALDALDAYIAAAQQRADDYGESYFQMREQRRAAVAHAEAVERERDEWKVKGHDAFQSLVRAGDNLRVANEKANQLESALQEIAFEAQQGIEHLPGWALLRIRDKALQHSGLLIEDQAILVNRGPAALAAPHVNDAAWRGTGCHPDCRADYDAGLHRPECRPTALPADGTADAE